LQGKVVLTAPCRAEALEAGRKALQEVRFIARNRAEIADYLARLAADEGDENLSLLSRREAFCSYPNLARLINLYREARDEEEAGVEMAWAAQKLEEITARTCDDVELEDRFQDLILLHARAILLAGQMEPAIELAKRGNPLGWTFGSDPQGVVVPCMLVVAAGIPPTARAPFIYKVWASYPAPDEAEDEFKALFLQSLRESPMGLQERHRLFSLLRPMINARIDAIMEGQKRDSYRKAGHLVLAEREVLIEMGRSREADELVEQASHRYPQASRFQRELRMAGVI
jgi:tetratricopeptide (TPR) repeat protein